MTKKSLIYVILFTLVASSAILSIQPALASHDSCYYDCGGCYSNCYDPCSYGCVTNRAPVWTSSIPNQTVQVGQTLTFTVSAFDPDGDFLYYSVPNLPVSAGFNPSTRQFTWTPYGGQNGTYNVQFRVSDTEFDAWMTVVVTVQGQPQNPNPNPNPNPTNQAPVWNQIGSQSVFVNQTLQFNVSAYDPEGQSIFYSASNLPSGASFNNNNRLFTWAPNFSQVGSYSVTFQAHDGYQSSYMNVPVTVLSNISNNSISLAAISNQNATENQLFAYQVLASTSFGSISYQISGPSGILINQTTGYITWVPTFSQGRAEGYPVTVTASNGQNQASQSFLIFVANFNPIPNPNPNPTPAPAPIEIRNIKIENRNGDVIVSWETNRPTRGRVIWGDQSEATKTANFTYDNATPEETILSEEHSANLGNLELNKTFYLRVVAKADSLTRTSQEIAFVKLNDGINNLGFLAGLAALLGFLMNPWIFLLAFLILGYLWYRYQKEKKKSFQPKLQL